MKKLLEVRNIQKSFIKTNKEKLLVIKNTNFSMKERERIAFVGKSGSGKSTLLKIIAGLISPSNGEIIYRGKKVNAPVSGISMVFQNFSLMPWLTVLQNVELGLEAKRIAKKERKERAIKAIDMIGMDGFENAYPKELSGGMCQRVGFARALVVKPHLLLMDEAFSSLDGLTAENLRNDLIEIWEKEKSPPMKGMILITHNIEEALLMSDRILIFKSNPGSIDKELIVNLNPHERNSQNEKFIIMIDTVYRLMTAAQDQNFSKKLKQKKLDLFYRLPDVQIGEIIGLLEAVSELEKRGSVNLPELADEVRLDIDTLFPILEVISVLKLSKISKGDINMNSKGKELLIADITKKKIIIADLLLKYIPLAKFIQETLKERKKSRERTYKEIFTKELEFHFTKEEADHIITTMIDWGRYAELFSYNYDTDLFTLEDTE